MSQHKILDCAEKNYSHWLSKWSNLAVSEHPEGHGILALIYILVNHGRGSLSRLSRTDKLLR